MPVRDRGFRSEVLARHQRCAVCGSTRGLVADHVIPLSRGGADHWSNGQALCSSDGRLGGCHAVKTAEENRKIGANHEFRAGYEALMARFGV